MHSEGYCSRPVCLSVKSKLIVLATHDKFAVYMNIPIHSHILLLKDVKRNFEINKSTPAWFSQILTLVHKWPFAAYFELNR